MLAALRIPSLEMTSPGGVSVIVAEADFFGSATLVAVIVTVCLAVMKLGAV